MPKVLVIRTLDLEDTIVKAVPLTSDSERCIERVERGANINLNHEKFYTDILDADDPDVVAFQAKKGESSDA